MLSGLSWVLASYASSLTMLYLTYGLIGGLGTGIVYVGVVGQMVGWFPDRRGFAAGVVAAGYGMGAIVTTFPITNSLAAVGYQMTLLQYGAIFALDWAGCGAGAEAAAECPLRRCDGCAGRGDRDDAALAGVLADVRDDDDDVHIGADGDLADGGVRRGVWDHQGDGLGALPRCRWR